VASAGRAWATPPTGAPRPSASQDHERIAVIDLGPAPAAGAVDVARELRAAVASAGFTPVLDDGLHGGLDDALAGRSTEQDALSLAAAMASAAQAFGALACAEVVPAARNAIGIAAARQAAGQPAPELARAWAYVLLCADREGQLDTAHVAAAQLRTLGGSPDVPPALWAKYPAIDAIAGRDVVELTIDTDVPGAAVWVDFRPVGVAPVRVELPAGDHVIAAAAGARRGWAAGTTAASQKTLRVPLSDTAGPWAAIAERVAGWHGKLPAPAELAWVLTRVRARVALVRHGNTVEAWGQVGRSEPPHLLGGDDGVAAIAETARVLGVIAERVASWNDHAPDPDQPLLTEDTVPRRRKDEPERPTKWWVYGAIGSALAVGATIILIHDSASERQRVELHYP